jgi:hypothetical protein
MSLRKACRRFAPDISPRRCSRQGHYLLRQSGYGFPPHCSVAEPDGCIRSDVLQQETKHRQPILFVEKEHPVRHLDLLRRHLKAF